jgi:hypothetical protein
MEIFFRRPESSIFIYPGSFCKQDNEGDTYITLISKWKNRSFSSKARGGIIAQRREWEIHIKFWLYKITLQQKSLMSPNLFLNNLNVEFNLLHPNSYEMFRKI